MRPPPASHRQAAGACDALAEGAIDHETPGGCRARSSRQYRRKLDVIAVAAGIALVIGWRHGVTRRAFELAAAAFVIVLAAQTVGLVITGRSVGAGYWPTVAAVAVGWAACIWVGDRARRHLGRPGGR